VISQPDYEYVPVPDSYYGGYYLSPGSRSGLSVALDDIKDAWMSGDYTGMVAHVDTGKTIAIYLDGKYSYSLPGKDYRDMTRDAIKHIETSDFQIYKVEKRSDGAYTAFGKHEFTDVDGNAKTAYVSYTLVKSGGRWIIVASGSSDNEL
jgi:hypothetical protein